jgi:hypothetical protein
LLILKNCPSVRGHELSLANGVEQGGELAAALPNPAERNSARVRPNPSRWLNFPALESHRLSIGPSDLQRKGPWFRRNCTACGESGLTYSAVFIENNEWKARSPGPGGEEWSKVDPSGASESRGQTVRIGAFSGELGEIRSDAAAEDSASQKAI